MSDHKKGQDDPASPRISGGGMDNSTLGAALFSEVFIAGQLGREAVGNALPGGMPVSQFSVLNLLAHLGNERSPAELARALHVTRGAMTNTLSRLERAGHIHIRPDWDDARRKAVAISPAGRAARDDALAAIMPMMSDAVRDIGPDRIRAALPVLRALRERLALREG